MSAIGEGLKQPLRFYDSVNKQNFRLSWIKDGLTDTYQILVNPSNTIMPFQLRRRIYAGTITTFDIYSYDSVYGQFYNDYSIFSIISGAITDHLRIVQSGTMDNILWNPQESFTQDLECGLHYIHLSDGVSNWYSEVFQVVADLDSTVSKRVSILPVNNGLGQTSAITWQSGFDKIILTLSKKPV